MSTMRISSGAPGTSTSRPYQVYSEEERKLAPPWLQQAMKHAGLHVSCGGIWRQSLLKLRAEMPASMRPTIDAVNTKFQGPYNCRREARDIFRRFLHQKVQELVPGMRNRSYCGGVEKNRARVKREHQQPRALALVKPEPQDHLTEQEAKNLSVNKKQKVEPGTDGKTSLDIKSEHAARSRHYRFQVAFLNSIVPPPWEIVFGSLGTGVIAVRPSPGKAKSQGEERTKEEQAKDMEVVPIVEEVVKKAHVHTKYEEAKIEEGSIGRRLPSDTTLCLLVGSPAQPLMHRNGRSTGYFDGDTVDAERGTMKWTSQRRDVDGRVIATIVAHCRNGGRLIVATRYGKGPGDKRYSFHLLGEVGYIDQYQKASFIVKEQDIVVLEKGTKTYHKNIGPGCLTPGLRCGIGLQAIKAPRPVKGKSILWCKSCCYQTGSVLLHFSNMYKGEVTNQPLLADKAEPDAEESKAEASLRPLGDLQDVLPHPPKGPGDLQETYRTSSLLHLKAGQGRLGLDNGLKAEVPPGPEGEERPTLRLRRKQPQRSQDSPAPAAFDRTSTGSSADGVVKAAECTVRQQSPVVPEDQDFKETPPALTRDLDEATPPPPEAVPIKVEIENVKLKGTVDDTLQNVSQCVNTAEKEEVVVVLPNCKPRRTTMRQATAS